MKIKEKQLLDYNYAFLSSSKLYSYFLTLSLLFSLQLIVGQYTYGQTDGENSQTATPKVDVTIEGTAADDRIKGGDGDDEITGEEGYDVLAGETGDDEIDGGEGNDQLNGGDGHDELIGGVGNDNIYGEKGMMK